MPTGLAVPAEFPSIRIRMSSQRVVSATTSPLGTAAILDSERFLGCLHVSGFHQHTMTWTTPPQKNTHSSRQWRSFKRDSVATSAPPLPPPPLCNLPPGRTLTWCKKHRKTQFPTTILSTNEHFEYPAQKNVYEILGAEDNFSLGYSGTAAVSVLPLYGAISPPLPRRGGFTS